MRIMELALDLRVGEEVHLAIESDDPLPDRSVELAKKLEDIRLARCPLRGGSLDRQEGLLDHPLRIRREVDLETR